MLVLFITSNDKQMSIMNESAGYSRPLNTSTDCCYCTLQKCMKCLLITLIHRSLVQGDRRLSIHWLRGKAYLHPPVSSTTGLQLHLPSGHSAAPGRQKTSGPQSLHPLQRPMEHQAQHSTDSLITPHTEPKSSLHLTLTLFSTHWAAREKPVKFRKVSIQAFVC